MPQVDRMPAVARHVMANNLEQVANVPHVEHATAASVSTITTAGVVTYTPAQFLGKLILRDPNGAARSDVTPTAALMLAAMPGAFQNQSIVIHIRNTADAAETITITAGAGATLSGPMTIAQNNGKSFLLVWTGVGATPTYTLYSLGSTVT